MTTVTVNTVRDLAQACGFNTHWNFTGWYESGGQHTGDGANSGPNANPAVIDAILESGMTCWRQRIFETNSNQADAIDQLVPAGLRTIGTIGDLTSGKAEITAIIHKFAQLCQQYGTTFVDFALPNEPNGGQGSAWPDKIKSQAGWARAAIDAETWPDRKPKLIGPGLMHNVGNLDHDIALLAAKHLEVECDEGDFHYYPGNGGPGARMNGLDDHGNMPDGIVLGTDGKCTVSHYELQRARQIYHDPNFPMNNTEFGWTSEDTDDSDTKWFLPEAYLRHYQLGYKSFVYELIDEWPYQSTDRGQNTGHARHEGEIAIYVVNPDGSPHNPPGPKPAFTGVKKLLGLNGTGTFSDIGHLIDIGGTLPDCGAFAFSDPVDNSFWLYLTREVEDTIRLVLDPAWVVEGGTLSSGHYDLDISGSHALSIFHIITTGEEDGCNLSGEGTLVMSDETLTASGTCTLAANGQLGAGAGGEGFGGTATLGGTGTLTFHPIPRQRDSAILVGTGTLNPLGSGSERNSASFSGTGTLSLFGRINKVGDCALSGTGQFGESSDASQGGNTTDGLLITIGTVTGQANVTGGASRGRSFNVSYVASGIDSSYKFFPPTYEENIPRLGFWSYFSTPKGKSVLRNLTTHLFEIHLIPTVDLLQQTGREGVDYFLGGRDYEVGAAIAAQLRESGFEVQGFESNAITWVGTVTSDEALVSTWSTGITNIGLGVWPVNQDKTQATMTTAIEPNVKGWAKHDSLTDLAPDFDYYVQPYDGITGTFISEPVQFRTKRLAGDAGAGISKVAYFCCKHSEPDVVTAAFEDMVDWGFDWSHDLGDRGYPSNLDTDPQTHMDNYAAQVAGPSLGMILPLGSNEYTTSDHDDNGTGRSNLPPGDDGGITLASIEAWKQVLPFKLEADNDRGRFSLIQGHVAFFYPDTRSPDRTDPADPHDRKNPHNPTNKMLGDDQLGRLLDAIDAAVDAGCAVGVFATDPAWAGTSDNPILVSEGDKWPSFIYQRDQIGGYAMGQTIDWPENPLFDGRVPHGVLPLYIVHGDDHVMKQDDGTGDTWGHATVGVGPVWQTLHAKFQEAVQWNYPPGANGDGDEDDKHSRQRFGAHYQRITIDDDTTEPGWVVITAEARDCTPPDTKGKPNNIPANTPLTVRTMTMHYRIGGDTGEHTFSLTGLPK